MPVTNYYSANGVMIAEHTTGQSRLDYVNDALGSVISTVDQTLTVKSTAKYKPYGAVLSETGTQPMYGWVGSPGYRRTGLPHSDIYVRKRHPSTVEGCWTTVDPSWPFEKAYLYAKASPTMMVDPSGLSACRTDPCEYCKGKDCRGRDRDHGTLQLRHKESLRQVPLQHVVVWHAHEPEYAL